MIALSTLSIFAAMSMFALPTKDRPFVWSYLLSADECRSDDAPFSSDGRCSADDFRDCVLVIDERLLVFDFDSVADRDSRTPDRLWKRDEQHT